MEMGYRLWINDELKYEFLQNEADKAQWHFEKFKGGGAFHVRLESYTILEDYEEPEDNG